MKRTAKHSDPLLKPGSRACRCSACGKYFGAPSGFDSHRVGATIERRCLTAEELTATGMTRDFRGYWRLPVHGPGAAARRGAGPR